MIELFAIDLVLASTDQVLSLAAVPGALVDLCTADTREGSTR